MNGFTRLFSPVSMGQNEEEGQYGAINVPEALQAYKKFMTLDIKSTCGTSQLFSPAQETFFCSGNPY